MRLFIGIELPRDVHTAAASAAISLREGIGRAARRTVIRWIPAENLHITVWFLGDVPDANTGALMTALEPPLATRRFDLQLGGAGTFPPAGPPRALWLGLRHGGDELAAVHEELRARLVPLGFKPESRPFAPHLTVARVKDIHRAAAPALRRVLHDARIPPASGAIEHATLFRSRTLPAGSQYEVLLRVPLI